MFRKLLSVLAVTGIIVAGIIIFSMLNQADRPAVTEDSKGQAEGIRHAGIQTDEPVFHINEQVDARGGSIVPADSASPLAGLKLDVAEGTFDQPTTFTISTATITSHGLGEHFNPLTPLIHIDNGSRRGQGVMRLTIPVDVPDGHFAMAFFYDPDKDILEGMTHGAVSDGSITVYTPHFSQIVVSSIARDLLESLITEKITTAFVPGKDDWQFPNKGSVLFGGGHCNGQVMSMLWYFYERRWKDNTRLNQRYNEGTPELWQDDVDAYRLASMVQQDYSTAYLATISPKEMKFDSFKKKATDRFVFAAAAYAMLLTREPQFLAVYGKDPYVHRNTYGHAVLTYAIEKNRLHVCDPNFPGVPQTIDLSNNSFKTYQSATKSGSPFLSFDWVNYYAKTLVYDWKGIGKRWEEFDAGTIGDGAFPDYELLLRQPGQPDQPIPAGAALQAVNSTAQVTVKWIGSGTRSSSPKLGSYDGTTWKFDPAAATDTVALNLQPGKNRIGIGIYDHNANDHYWAGFEYITLLLGPAIEQLSSSAAREGDSVDIVGSGFGDSAAEGEVYLDNNPIPASGWSDGRITFTVPAGTATGMVRVEHQGLSSNAVQLTIVPDQPATAGPALTHAQPQDQIVFYEDWSAQPMQLMIYGNGLDALGSGGRVTVGGVEAIIRNYSEGHIDVIVPQTADSGSIVVLAEDGSVSNQIPFTRMDPLVGLHANAGFDCAFGVDFDVETEEESPWTFYNAIKTCIEDRDLLGCDVAITWNGSSFEGRSEEQLSSPQVYGVMADTELKKLVTLSGTVSLDGAVLQSLKIDYLFPFRNPADPEHYYGQIECSVSFTGIPLYERKSFNATVLNVPHTFLPRNGAFEQHLTSFSIKGVKHQLWGNDMRRTSFSSAKPVFDSQDIVAGYSMALKREKGNAR